MPTLIDLRHLHPKHGATTERERSREIGRVMFFQKKRKIEGRGEKQQIGIHPGENKKNRVKRKGMGCKKEHSCG